MKKLINLRCLVSVNGEEYCDTSIWQHLRYDDTIDEIEVAIAEWEEAYKAVSKNKIRNAKAGATLFRNRPTIIIHYGDINRCDREFSEKEFKSLRFKWLTEEVNQIYTIKELADLLPADQFCEWLKDQGISIIGG